MEATPAERKALEADREFWNAVVTLSKAQTTIENPSIKRHDPAIDGLILLARHILDVERSRERSETEMNLWRRPR